MIDFLLMLAAIARLTQTEGVLEGRVGLGPGAGGEGGGEEGGRGEVEREEREDQHHLHTHHHHVVSW